MTIELVDHAAVALSRMRQVFRTPSLEADTLIDISGLQEIEAALYDLVVQRGLDGTGYLLDRVGSAIGETRQGADDTAYRARLRARVLANKSSGTRNELIAVAHALFGDRIFRLAIEPAYPAGIIVRTEGAAFTGPEGDLLFRFLTDAAADGVRLIVVTSGYAESAMFSCAADTETVGGAMIGDTDLPVYTDGFSIGDRVRLVLTSPAQTVDGTVVSLNLVHLDAPLLANRVVGETVGLLNTDGSAMFPGAGFGDDLEVGQPELVPYGSATLSGGRMVDDRG